MRRELSALVFLYRPGISLSWRFWLRFGEFNNFLRERCPDGHAWQARHKPPS